MAIQTGLYTFRKKLANVKGFKIKTLTPWFVGMSGGPTKEQIETDPNFARTRENMSEFGGSSMAGRIYRVGAAQLYNYFYQYLSGNLGGKIVGVTRLGPGPRGEREILFSTNFPPFVGYNLNPFTTFNSISFNPYTISTNIGRNQGTLFIPSFNPQIFLNIPINATHFQYVLNCVAMSDWQFTTNVGYNPKNVVANGVNQTTFGAFLPVNAVAANQTIVALLPGSPSMTNATLFNTIGIQFFQLVPPIYYPFFENNAAKISNLF